MQRSCEPQHARLLPGYRWTHGLELGISEPMPKVTLNVLSGKDLLDDAASDVGEAEIAASVAEGESLVVKAQQVQHSGVQVMHTG